MHCLYGPWRTLKHLNGFLNGSKSDSSDADFFYSESDPSTSSPNKASMCAPGAGTLSKACPFSRGMAKNITPHMNTARTGALTALPNMTQPMKTPIPKPMSVKKSWMNFLETL